MSKFDDAFDDAFDSAFGDDGFGDDGFGFGDDDDFKISDKEMQGHIRATDIIVKQVAEKMGGSESGWTPDKVKEVMENIRSGDAPKGITEAFEAGVKEVLEENRLPVDSNYLENMIDTAADYKSQIQASAPAPEQVQTFAISEGAQQTFAIS